MVALLYFNFNTKYGMKNSTLVVFWYVYCFRIPKRGVG